jgi:hypothetical protein
MIRAGLVVIVVVSVVLLMMVMTVDWLHAWPFPSVVPVTGGTCPDSWVAS